MCVLSPELIELVAFFLRSDLAVFAHALPPSCLTAPLVAFTCLAERLPSANVAWPNIELKGPLAPDAVAALKAVQPLGPEITVILATLDATLLQVPYASCITRVVLSDPAPVPVAASAAVRDALLACPRLSAMVLLLQSFSVSYTWLDVLLEAVAHPQLAVLSFHCAPDVQAFLSPAFAHRLVAWLQTTHARELSLRSVRFRLEDDPALQAALRRALQARPDLRVNFVDVDIFEAYELHGQHLPQAFRSARWLSSLVSTIKARPAECMARALLRAATEPGRSHGHAVETVAAPELPTFMVTSHGELPPTTPVPGLLPTLPHLCLVHLHWASAPVLRHLVDVLPHCRGLTHMTLTGDALNPPLVQQLLAAVRQSPRLEWLGLVAHACSSADIVALAPTLRGCMDRLRYLNLSGRRWTPRDKESVLDALRPHPRFVEGPLDDAAPRRDGACDVVIAVAKPWWFSDLFASS
ncbi:hypothetical protein ACHHYP_13725 [Achlya hypogyna]|uniref:Uncharacterized protein n=1 Tax=Achlya hypogyna TaxID=1202772 RepID=A0A1V9YER2_ACHHY|nr:hypothetical protein ACHHYP_13725 [Achlya hypogyna]